MMNSPLLFELSRLFNAEARLTRDCDDQEHLESISRELYGKAVEARHEEAAAGAGPQTLRCPAMPAPQEAGPPSGRRTKVRRERYAAEKRDGSTSPDRNRKRNEQTTPVALGARGALRTNPRPL
jgi:hypothetical protein